MRTFPMGTKRIRWFRLLFLATATITVPAAAQSQERAPNQDLTFSLGGIAGQTRSFQGSTGRAQISADRSLGINYGHRLLEAKVVASCVRLQLGPLPSTGITRLPQYCEPLRHPSRPGLSLASCQLIHTAITAGTSRVVYGPLCLHAVANTPAGLARSCSLVPSHQLRPSPKSGRVGSCISLFEACSAFTHVTACLLTESL